MGQGSYVPTSHCYLMLMAHGCVVAIGHGRPYFERQPYHYGCLAASIVFMKTHPTHHHLESSGSSMDMEIRPKPFVARQLFKRHVELIRYSFIPLFH